MSETLSSPIFRSSDLLEEPVRQPGPNRNKTIFQFIQENVSTKVSSSDEENTKSVSTRTHFKAITRAVEILRNDRQAALTTIRGGSVQPGKEYLLKCASLLGLRIFEAYPRVITLTKICTEGINKFAAEDEMDVYSDTDDVKYPVKELTDRLSSSRQIPVTVDVKKYVGDKHTIFKLCQADLVMYFQVLGLLAVDAPTAVYGEQITKKLIQFKRLINERIYERFEEIEWYNNHKDKSIFENCLAYDGELKHDSEIHC
jgi:hypothetical protein